MIAAAAGVVAMRSSDGGLPLVATRVDWFARKLAGRIDDNLHGLMTALVDLSDRFCLVYLLASVLFAAVVFARHERGRDLGDFLRFLFPKQIYRHGSARIDLGVFLINRIFTPAVLITRLWTVASVAAAITALLGMLWGPHERVVLSDTGSAVLLTLATVLVTDFGDYLSHVLHHRIPLLWQFHKLHHSAEVLTPFTVARIHPMEQVAATLISTAVAGLVIGIAGYAVLEQPQPIHFVGAQAVSVAFMAAGSHLRHSHVWLSWGRVLSRIAISPAQHQIHHSVAPEHRDRNYGFMFAIWDCLFGTLYVPRNRERLTFGLADATGVPTHRTLSAAYVEPFRSAAAVIAGWLPSTGRRERGGALAR